MKLTDTHCHLYSEYFDNFDLTIKECNDLGVDRFINAGVDLDSCKEILDISKKYENIFCTLGVHPENVEFYKDDDLSFISEHLLDDGVVALGEIGLDYHYTKEFMEEQKCLFRKQLRIAESVDKPVVIHTRDATLDTINILKEYNVRGVIHSFSGSLETAKIFIKMGFVLGISGVITFKNCNLKDVVRELNPSDIIIETDAPYLAPVPYRGKKNIPGYAFEILKFVADLFNISSDEMVDISNETIKRIFDI